MFGVLHPPCIANQLGPAYRSEFYTEDTSFASLELEYRDEMDRYLTMALLFFQDPDGWIRLGAFEDPAALATGTN
jgi:hypothetical protein